VLWLRALVFGIIAPGTVGGYIPFVLTRHDGATRVHMPPIVRLVGLVLASVGVAGLFWCFALFVRRGRGTPAPYDPPQLLVTSGPYEMTRNPMYVSLALLLTGELLMTGSRSLALYEAFVALPVYLFVRFVEEPQLRRRFGAAYADYCARVPRWIAPSKLFQAFDRQ
jgi:protein-S-isoprenylcysteine O-methyltransferase Ste14